VLLLDEPLGALDKNLRENMQFELRRIQRTLGITTILVTHDQDEALTLRDQVVVMNHGRILQVGSPSDVYEYPKTRFVSEFLGTSNLFEGELGAANANGVRDFVLGYGGGEARLQVLASEVEAERRRAMIAVRPEKVTVTDARPDAGNMLAGQVQGHVFRGSYHAYEVRVAGREEPVFVYNQARSRAGEHVFEAGQNVFLSWSVQDSIVLRDD
jgi:ABC-type Fe3+/spermidine/putrescine transport system ATPase subunit